MAAHQQEIQQLRQQLQSNEHVAAEFQQNLLERKKMIQDLPKSKSVLTCSLDALLQSCRLQSLGERLRNLSLSPRPKVWHQLADTPVALSTCASLQGQLLAVGGKDSDDKETAAIRMYDTTTNSWEVISHMVTPRFQCFVAILPHNELMIVGGNSAGYWTSTDSVEFASIV